MLQEGTSHAPMVPFLDRIREAAPQLTDSERLLADYFVANPAQIAFWPANRFARAVGVSEATVIRFARSLNYDSYGAFQKAVQQQIEEQLRESIPVRLQRSLEVHGSHPLVNVVQDDIRNLQGSLESVDPADFERAVAYLSATPQLFVAGMRASAGVATYAAYTFSYLVPEVVSLSFQSETQFDHLARSRPGACVLAFAFARNSRRTIQIAEVGRERGAKVIVFTDSPLAPIAASADALLTCPTHSSSFIESFTAVISVLNALVLATSQSRGTESLGRSADVERLLTRYAIVLPSGRSGP